MLVLNWWWGYLWSTPVVPKVNSCAQGSLLAVPYGVPGIKYSLAVCKTLPYLLYSLALAPENRILSGKV